MREAFIVDACRTPRGVGKLGKGALADLHPQQLGAVVLNALRNRNGFDTADVGDIIWSTSTQIDKQSANLGRMTALAAGYDVKAPALTLDRFCGGGVTAVQLAAANIMSGMEDLIVAGGAEMMSFTNALPSSGRFLDRGNPELRALHPQINQGVAADIIATLEGITRLDVDAFGLQSQQRAGRAMAEGWFASGLIPVMNASGRVLLDHDELPRPQTTPEALAALKPAFKDIADLPLDAKGVTYRQLVEIVYPGLAWTPIHHAGNSSGIADGAAAVLLASGDYAREHALRPRARVVAFATVGDSPTLMLNAPGPAVRKVLARAGLEIDDIDLWEVNEAFAVVVEKLIRDLDLDREKVNVNGGAIALGHPIGATGAVLVSTLLDELERRDLRRGLVTMCTAGGMAPALILERIV